MIRSAAKNHKDVSVLVDPSQYQIFLEERNIQTRVVFTGNILKQPVMKNKIYNFFRGFK